MLIAIEGLDQSGKATQAQLLRDHLRGGGTRARLVSFPDYGTSIGEELARALQGERDYAPEVMQLLYIANRYERKADLERWLAGGLVVVSDRYVASSIAYGEAQGLDAAWLTQIQRFLPAAELTILLDIVPELAVERKATGRDRYERDLALLGRVRESYLQQAEQAGWVRVDGGRGKADVAADIMALIAKQDLEPSEPSTSQQR
jgi:dTMP kinase